MFQEDKEKIDAQVFEILDALENLNVTQEITEGFREYRKIGAELFRRLKEDENMFCEDHKSTRHGVAEDLFLFERMANGEVAMKIRWPDFIVMGKGGTRLVEVKSIRPGKGRDKISEEQLLSHKMIKLALGLDVEIAYVELKPKHG